MASSIYRYALLGHIIQHCDTLAAIRWPALCTVDGWTHTALGGIIGRGGLIDGEYRRYMPLIARVEGVCTVVAWVVRGCDSSWMAEAWLVGKCVSVLSQLSQESVGRQSRPEPKARRGK